ncbi:MAG: hypothetical protein WB566_08685, partial [Terriglobales bacterium]
MPDNVLAREVRAVTRERLDDFLREFALEFFMTLPAEVRPARHHVPAIGRVLAGRRLRRVDDAERA